MNSKQIVGLVCFGKGGDTVYYKKIKGDSWSGGTGSGYGNPDKPHAADFSKESKQSVEIPDGTPVVDMRNAVESKDGYAWAYKGPMPNVNIENDTIDKCPDLKNSIVAQAVMSDQGNAFGGIAAMHLVSDRSKPGPLDSVSAKAYSQGWKEHGARIGHYENRQIIWDD